MKLLKSRDPLIIKETIEREPEFSKPEVDYCLARSAEGAGNEPGARQAIEHLRLLLTQCREIANELGLVDFLETFLDENPNHPELYKFRKR